jgi:peroxiredoxin
MRSVFNKRCIVTISAFVSVILLSCLLNTSKNKLETELDFKIGVDKINLTGDGKHGTWARWSREPIAKLTQSDRLLSDSVKYTWFGFSGLEDGGGRLTVMAEWPITKKSRLIIDENNNKDLTDDTIRKWNVTKKDTFNRVKFQNDYSDSLGAYKRRHIIRVEKQGDFIFAYNDGYREGSIIINGRKYIIALYDMGFDGLYGNGWSDAIFVDINGDEKIDGEFHGTSLANEFFYWDEPFQINGKDYIVDWVSPVGDKIRIKLSDKPASPRYPLGLGKPAPDFSVTAMDGEKLILSDYRGKVVLLDFWAAWCGPCKEELPYLLEAHERFSKHGFQIIGISLDNDMNTLTEFLKKQHLPWPQFHEENKRWDNEVAKLYRVIGIPHTFLIDREGIIRYIDAGEDELFKNIENLIN